MLTPTPPDRSVPMGQGSAGSNVTEPPDKSRDLYQEAMSAATGSAVHEGEQTEAAALETKLMELVQTARTGADRYMNYVRKGWSRSYRSFGNEHFSGSKYNSEDYKGRSRLFRPKTRSAIRKAMAGVASSLFSTVDAVAISAGNEADPHGRAAADLLQEVLNYRLDRTSGKNAIPWFKTAMGAVQDSLLTGIVVSVQNWKLEVKDVEQPVMAPDPVTGQSVPVPGMTETVQKRVFDRPDCVVLPPENVTIDAGCDWTDPAQSAAFIILDHPMKADDIRQHEKHPTDPWRHVSDAVLATGRADNTNTNKQGVRSSRDGGNDRMSQVNQVEAFATIWVSQVFMRFEGEDYTWWCIGQHALSEPRTVEEAYPWNDGERPVVVGFGSLESHKPFPMSAAESWQPLQMEINDVANLTLDTIKMNIAPVAKVVRGRQVELEKLKRRAPGTNILVNSIEDVAFEKPPGVDGSAWQQLDRLGVDFDTLAGQFDTSSVQTNRQLNETVGGMRLISGAANALQEFDQRVFFETWAEPVIGQIVRLCQYYEDDEKILGLCGDRAQLWEKHGLNQITDDLMDSQVTVRIDIGIGAGDPQQRLAKFQQAAAIAVPLLQQHPDFMSGKYKLSVEGLMQEIFGAAGYRDGGKRFLDENQQAAQTPPGPPPDPNMAKIQGELELKAKQQEAAQKLEADRANAEIANKAKQTQADIDLKERIAQAENARKQREHKIATDIQVREHNQRMKHARQGHEIKTSQVQQERDFRAQEHQQSRAMADDEFNRKREDHQTAQQRADEEHRLKREEIEAQRARAAEDHGESQKDRKIKRNFIETDAAEKQKDREAKRKAKATEKSAAAEKPAADAKGNDEATAKRDAALAGALHSIASVMSRSKSVRKGPNGEWLVEYGEPGTKGKKKGDDLASALTAIAEAAAQPKTVRKGPDGWHVD